jgi:hypothetical protein
MTTVLAERLRGAADSHRAGASDPADLRLTFDDLLRVHGDSSGAVLLMLLAVVSVLPLAGTGTVMSLGIWAVAWAWTKNRDMRLPSRLGSVTLNERWSGRCLHGLAWIYEQSNRWMRPRWALWSHERTRVWWACWIALMGIVIFLPLPLGNVLPSLSLILLSLGWMFRDGLALLTSIFTGLIALAYGVSLWHLVSQALTQAWGMLG